MALAQSDLLCNNEHMHCPRCKHPNFVATGTCPFCGFKGAPNQIEELTRLEWLLSEMDVWVEQGILKKIPKRLQKHYQTRYQKIQFDLGLQSISFSPQDAIRLWPELRCHELLFQEIEKWLAAGQIKTGFLPKHYARLIELQGRMSGYRGAQAPATDSERLDEINFLLAAILSLKQRNEFITSEASSKITAPLLAEKVKLENILNGPAEIKVAVKTEGADKKIKPASPPGPEPIPPITPQLAWRERLWRSILSERTLQALLFLGIFLLFVAAISFVVWGWKDFSAPVRVAIPFGFTVLFFSLGWLVRQRTHLERSAIALSAIAALLIPIDFIRSMPITVRRQTAGLNSG